MISLHLCHAKGRRALLAGVLIVSALLSGCGAQPAKQESVTTEGVTETDAVTVFEETTQPHAEPTVESAPIRYFLEREWITMQDVRTHKDNQGTLSLLMVSLGELLERGGITELVNDQGETSPTSHYGSWYLYTLGDICSLFYMRTGTESSGAGISFIELDFEALKTCLESGETQAHLKDMLTAVTTASADGRHCEALTTYFGDSLSGGSYLLAETFVEAVISGVSDGVVSSPSHYATCSVEDAEFVRVTQALRYLNSRYPELILWEGDRPVGIRIANPESPTAQEKQAVLTLYTMDVTFCSFAAEVAVHANMCAMDFMGSYDRCKIADMAAGAYSSTAGVIARWDNEFGFYNLNSTAVRSQEENHPDYKGEYDPT